MGRFRLSGFHPLLDLNYTFSGWWAFLLKIKFNTILDGQKYDLGRPKVLAWYVKFEFTFSNHRTCELFGFRQKRLPNPLSRAAEILSYNQFLKADFQNVICKIFSAKTFREKIMVGLKHVLII